MPFKAGLTVLASNAIGEKLLNVSVRQARNWTTWKWQRIYNNKNHERKIFSFKR
jgi:hypothetical protein